MHLLVDIGGTNMRLAKSLSDQAVDTDTIERIPTEKNFEAALEILNTAIRRIIRETPLEEIIVGVPGPLDAERTMIVNAPHLPDWNGKPLKERLERMAEVPVLLEHDGILAGLGEAHFGVGKGFPIVAYLTVSTGVGGARIVNGMPDINRFGFEPGQQIMRLDGGKKTLEQLVSGAALEERHAKKAEDISDPAVWEEVTENLAIGLSNTIVHWSPDIVVLGGSVMKSIDMEKLRQKVRETVKIFPVCPRVEKAVLDEPVLWGGLASLEIGKRNSA